MATTIMEYRGYVDIQQIIAAGKLNDLDKNGKSLVVHVIQHNEYEKVEYLLSRGALVNENNHGQGNALMAAAANDNVEILKLLSTKVSNFKVNHQNRSGMTMLMVAARHGCLENIKYLLSLNANIRQFDIDGESALMMAAKSSNSQAVDLLLQRAIDLRNQSKSSGIFKNISGENVIKGALLGAFIIPVAAISLGAAAVIAPLYAAAGGLNVMAGTAVIGGVVGGLIKKPEPPDILFDFVNRPDNVGRTALMYAAMTGNVGALGSLLNAGAILHQVDKNGSTALSLARNWNQNLAVLMLLERDRKEREQQQK
jgi:uncharacterized protein